MDKGGPSGDYDASKTSLRESKASTLIIMEDMRENHLNGIRQRALNLAEFKNRSAELLAHQSARHNMRTSSDRSGEQTSPRATTIHIGNVNNFTSTASFDRIEDHPPNSPCSNYPRITHPHPRPIHNQSTLGNCARAQAPNEPALHTNIWSCDNAQIQRALSPENMQECGALTARCVEIPPKRMRVTTPCAVLTKEDCAVLELRGVRNYEFRGCLSAVDSQCESLVDIKPRICKSRTDSRCVVLDKSSAESTQYMKSSTGESLSQICMEIQRFVTIADDSPNNKPLESQRVFESDISSKSQSTTSFEPSEATKTNNSHSTVQTNDATNRLLDDFNNDSDKCSNCECITNDHYSISRPASSYTSCDNNTHFKITIPSSAEDDEFINAACLEPNITTIDDSKRHRSRSKFRFWRFKRRKDQLGSGDTSATSSLSYIVSPVVNSDINLRMITKCEKPNKRTTKLNILDSKSGDSVDFVERELSVLNYSDFCIPIKSLEKLPDDSAVKDILQTMSQSVFKKSAAEIVDSIGDCSDLKEDRILKQFSSYAQFKTRAELLAEHLKVKDEETELSKVVKEAAYNTLPPVSSSDDNSEGSYYLNRRKQQNTQIRFYEIPSPMNSSTNVNRLSGECGHAKVRSMDTVVKVDEEEVGEVLVDDEDDVSTGFCANCFCKHLLFPKMSRSYFL